MRTLKILEHYFGEFSDLIKPDINLDVSRHNSINNMNLSFEVKGPATYSIVFYFGTLRRQKLLGSFIRFTLKTFSNIVHYRK